MGPNFGQIGPFVLDVFAHSGHIFQLLASVLVPVDGLKRVDFKNTRFFDSLSMLRVVN